MVLRNLSPKWIRNYHIRSQREKTQLGNYEDMDKCQSATCWVQLCPSLGSYLESFRVYYKPDIVLVNTTNTTLEKRWALSSRRSLSRKKKKCIPQNKCNGRRGHIANGPKVQRGLGAGFWKINRYCKCREVEWSLIIHCSQSLTCHRSRNKQTWTRVYSWHLLVKFPNLLSPPVLWANPLSHHC